MAAVDGERSEHRMEAEPRERGGLRVRLHTIARHAAAAASAVSWKNKRFARTESPASHVPVAANPTNAGPNTDARCRQIGLTRRENGSDG